MKQGHRAHETNEKEKKRLADYRTIFKGPQGQRVLATFATGMVFSIHVTFLATHIPRHTMMDGVLWLLICCVTWALTWSGLIIFRRTVWKLRPKRQRERVAAI